MEFGVEGLRRRLERGPADLELPDGRQAELRANLDAILGKRFTGTLGLEWITAESAQPFISELSDYSVIEGTVGLNWFHPSGFFIGGRAGVAHHRSEGADPDTGVVDTSRDTFPISELVGGYRLPEGRGVVTLEISNISDTDFGFADRPGLPGTLNAEPRYAREFSAIGRITLGF